MGQQLVTIVGVMTTQDQTEPPIRPPYRPPVPGSPDWGQPHPEFPIAGIPGISLPIMLPGMPGWGLVPLPPYIHGPSDPRPTNPIAGFDPIHGTFPDRPTSPGEKPEFPAQLPGSTAPGWVYAYIPQQGWGWVFLPHMPAPGGPGQVPPTEPPTEPPPPLGEGSGQAQTTGRPMPQPAPTPKK